MRKDFGKKPWIYPQPVLIIATYDEEGNPDIMNAAWGGVGDDTQIFIYPERAFSQRLCPRGFESLINLRITKRRGKILSVSLLVDHQGLEPWAP